MTLYERIEFLRNKEGISQGKLEKKLGISNGSISKWKTSMPKPDRLQKVADHFGVTIDFLMGKTDKILCPECEFYYNPLDKESVDLHEQVHKSYNNAISKYGFYYSSDEYMDEMPSCLNLLSNLSFEYSTDDIANTYIKYLKIEFSDLLRKSNYNLKYDSFNDYVAEQIVKDMHQNFMSHDLFIKLAETYNIDTEYIGVDEQLLARVSNNEQLMRILAYAERLAPETLKSIEVQIKALSDSEKQG